MQKQPTRVEPTSRPCEAGMLCACGKTPTRLCSCCGLHLCATHEADKKPTRRQ